MSKDTVKATDGSGAEKAKRTYVRRNLKPIQVFEVKAGAKSLALFQTRERADAFATQAHEMAAALGGKLDSKPEVVERTAN